MPYVDINGMVRQDQPGAWQQPSVGAGQSGGNPVVNLPFLGQGGQGAQPSGGQATWSPGTGNNPSVLGWSGPGPYQYTAGHTNPLSAWAGVTGQQPGAANGGLLGNQNQGGGGNIGNYVTGIKSGALPQASIDSAVSRLTPPNMSAPTNGVPMSGGANSTIQGLMGDMLRSGTSAAQTDMARNGAYQQAQMGLTRDKAMADAALRGWGGMLGEEEARIANQIGQSSIKNSLLSAVLGQVMGGLGGLV